MVLPPCWTLQIVLIQTPKFVPICLIVIIFDRAGTFEFVKLDTVALQYSICGQQCIFDYFIIISTSLTMTFKAIWDLTISISHLEIVWRTRRAVCQTAAYWFQFLYFCPLSKTILIVLFLSINAKIKSKSYVTGIQLQSYFNPFAYRWRVYASTIPLSTIIRW